MAGEKLDKRFGKGFTDRVKSDGMQEPTDSGRYSKKELLAEFRGRPKGVSIDEGEGNLVDKFQGLVDSGTTFNRQAQDYLEGHGVVFNRPEEIEMIDEPEEVEMIDELIDVPARGNFGIQNAPVNQTINNSSDSEFLDDLTDDSYGFSGGGMGVDYNQTQNINYNDLQDFDISGSNNYINAPLNASNSMTGGDITFAQRNPAMDFKNNYMSTLFS